MVLYLKYDTHELISETDTESRTENTLMGAKGESVGEVRTGRLGLAELYSISYDKL